MSHAHDLMPLVLGIAAVFAGPVLLSVTSRFSRMSAGLHWCTLSLVVLLVGVLVLPECWREAGLWAGASLALGLALPVATERLLHSAPRRLSLWLPLVPLVVHAALDGAALRVGAHHAESAAHAGHGLVAALVLHRIPEGLAIFSLASAHGRRTAFVALTLDGLFTAIGFFALTTDASPRSLALFEAFVGGILLHVLLHERPRPIATQTT